ncbi:beta-galactosidase [Lacrimispora sp. 210928-DFI.3.58]|uniref:beta-galactosidase n=1 Tax=Lacrimispora sp. 210928-DFI.3.58 TaxID=2883214 RepID=UPI0015B71DFB|nr:beta-galactosidase [Lacrimispora sp. 210928-DFI.3.58]MCB7318340.1 beta-galactosidase [Lacrimispora sp. 210928-DFI.3.58]
MKDYLFGAVYIIEQDYTEEEIRRDLSLMRNHGCNLVTLWPVGNPWLAESSHEWKFDQTRMVLDECQALGMKAILQLFGQNQAQEFMPDSALTEEMMIQDERGEHVNENCFWANLNHPVVREYMDLFFKKAITSLKDHPAVFGFDVFNEAHFRSDDAYTVRKYQRWLEERYGSIEKLNRKWYRRYESFSQILPKKRRSAYSIWSSILPDLEYEKFRSENLTEICRFLYETAKKYDQSHPIIIDGTSAQIFSGDVTLRNNDEFATARIPDIYGSTFYPKSWGRNYRYTPWTMAMYYSVPAAAARKAGKPYIVNELQTHTQSILTPGSEVSPQELYNWILMCMFTGSCGMQLWRWRPFLHGYQSAGRGLTQMDGTPNERAGRVRELACWIQGQKDLFSDFTVRRPVVKIAVSYSSRLFFDCFLKWNGSFWSKDVEGWYRMFWNYGLPAEFADLEHLEGEEADVLILPSILSVSREMAENLRSYVENGGILIADARLGAVNEYGEVPAEGIPGTILSELFGVREKDVESEGSFLLGGKELPCPFMDQILETEEEASIAARMAGEKKDCVAVVVHPVGKGKTIYFNSFIGLEFKENRCAEAGEFLMRELLEKKPQVLWARKRDQVHVSYISSGKKTAALVINFSSEPDECVLFGLKEGTELENRMTGERVTAGNETVLSLPADTAYVYSWDEEGKPDELSGI